MALIQTLLHILDVFEDVKTHHDIEVVFVIRQILGESGRERYVHAFFLRKLVAGGLEQRIYIDPVGFSEAELFFPVDEAASGKTAEVQDYLVAKILSR